MSLVVETQSIPEAWWREIPDRACVIEYTCGGQIVAVAAEWNDSLVGAAGAALRFRVFPVDRPPQTPPREVRLRSIIGGESCAFVLRMIGFEKDRLTVDARPISAIARPLRRFPRVPYRLGPCTAVVHSAMYEWRGLVEFWVRDVSAHGVGFTLVAGHADRVDVGNRLRAPVTLPDGQRSWIDGEVVRLAADGRGGLRTRRAPQWPIEVAPLAPLSTT